MREKRCKMHWRQSPDPEWDQSHLLVSGPPSVAPGVYHPFTVEDSREVSSPKLLVNDNRYTCLPSTYNLVVDSVKSFLSFLKDVVLFV